MTRIEKALNRLVFRVRRPDITTEEIHQLKVAFLSEWAGTEDPLSQERPNTFACQGCGGPTLTSSGGVICIDSESLVRCDNSPEVKNHE